VLEQAHRDDPTGGYVWTFLPFKIQIDGFIISDNSLEIMNVGHRVSNHTIEEIPMLQNTTLPGIRSNHG
jgi:hypothetical protein